MHWKGYLPIYINQFRSYQPIYIDTTRHASDTTRHHQTCSRHHQTPPDTHQTISDRLAVVLCWFIELYSWSRFLARDGRTGERTKVFQEVLADLKMVPEIVTDTSEKWSLYTAIKGSFSFGVFALTQALSSPVTPYQELKIKPNKTTYTMDKSTQLSLSANVVWKLKTSNCFQLLIIFTFLYDDVNILAHK